jgi:hypothetical protein|tara:strand:- start:211 stop:423 length:213 start_codon:yes stop_codon:yes gene_type:complete
MKVEERDELLVRMDERVKTVYNRMDRFETLFTNHLAHHESWEKDMNHQMRWGIGILTTVVAGLIAALRFT